MKPRRVPTQRAGDRNTLVQVEENVPSTNADGQKVEAWVRRFELYAEVVPRTGREARRFDQLRAEVDFIVRMLFDDESRRIRPANWRVLVDGRELNIGGVYTLRERQSVIELHCTEVVV